MLGHESSDDWFDRALPEGQRIAVIGPGAGIGLGAPVSGDITRDASKFFEGLQVAGKREFAGDVVDQPGLPDRIRVYEVRGGDLGVSESLARSNPQAGIGGDPQVFVPDIHGAIASGRLVEVEPHYFDLKSTQGRMEDPQFLQADPTLPDRAINPDAERVEEAVKVGGLQMARNVGGTAAVAAERIDQGTVSSN